jgi:transcriptional regulator with XRE-family HTH domain
MKSQALPVLPLAVERALRKFGEDIKDARRRRRIPTSIMAERAMISRSTLARAEKGSPEVSIGIYVTILFILGLEQKIADLADIRADEVGLDLEEERLPQRIHLAKRPKEKDPS